MELLFSRSRIKQLPDKAPITLDDFIDDLFVGEIVCKPETQQYLRIIHCCKKRIRTPELLPIEWLEQYRWQGEPLSRLRNGKTSDYKVGNDIEKMLLADPEKTKQEITRHIGKILDNAGTVYYGTMLEAYVFSLLGISDAVGESRDAVKKRGKTEESEPCGALLRNRRRRRSNQEKDSRYAPAQTVCKGHSSVYAGADHPDQVQR